MTELGFTARSCAKHMPMEETPMDWLRGLWDLSRISVHLTWTGHTPLPALQPL